MLVRKIDGVWQEWHGDATVTVQVATLTAHYHDGRVEELACDPYPVDQVLNGDRLAQLLAEGVWTSEEVDAAGAKIAAEFVVPEGKQIVGAARYVESKGKVRQVYDVEDIPPPPPPTIEDKLAAIGLTREDLRAVLAGDEAAKG